MGEKKTPTIDELRFYTGKSERASAPQHHLSHKSRKHIRWEIENVQKKKNTCWSVDTETMRALSYSHSSDSPALALSCSCLSNMLPLILGASNFQSSKQESESSVELNVFAIQKCNGIARWCNFQFSRKEKEHSGGFGFIMEWKKNIINFTCWSSAMMMLVHTPTLPVRANL